MRVCDILPDCQDVLGRGTMMEQEIKEADPGPPVLMVEK